MIKLASLIGEGDVYIYISIYTKAYKKRIKGMIQSVKVGCSTQVTAAQQPKFQSR